MEDIIGRKHFAVAVVILEAYLDIKADMKTKMDLAHLDENLQKRILVFFGKDSHCYTVYETITPDTRYTEGNVAGKDYTKALGHYSNFGSCLKKILKNNQK